MGHRGPLAFHSLAISLKQRLHLGDEAAWLDDKDLRPRLFWSRGSKQTAMARYCELRLPQNPRNTPPPALLKGLGVDQGTTGAGMPGVEGKRESWQMLRFRGGDGKSYQELRIHVKKGRKMAWFLVL